MPLARGDDGWSWDGEAVSEEEVVERRDQQIEEWGAELQLIAVEELNISPAMQAIEFPETAIGAFAVRFLNRITEIITSAYVFANGGTEKVTDSGWRVVATLVERQVEYGRGFVASLRQGTISEAQAVARSRMYAGGGIEAFERGRVSQMGLELPAYPGDGGTPCLVNCRCFWEINEREKQFEATWIMRGDKETCSGCEERAGQWSPYVQVK